MTLIGSPINSDRQLRQTDRQTEAQIATVMRFRESHGHNDSHYSHGIFRMTDLSESMPQPSVILRVTSLVS